MNLKKLPTYVGGTPLTTICENIQIACKSTDNVIHQKNVYFSNTSVNRSETAEIMPKKTINPEAIRKIKLTGRRSSLISESNRVLDIWVYAPTRTFSLNNLTNRQINIQFFMQRILFESLLENVKFLMMLVSFNISILITIGNLL